MTIESTGVVGAGLMGRDIAGLLANAGYAVTLVDVDAGALREARQIHETKLVETLREEGFEIRGDPAERITYEQDVSTLADAEFVVEAVPEVLEVKQDVAASLETVLDGDSVIGTNTSSLTPTDVAAGLDHPERVVLFHFANPAIRRDLVEIAGDDAAEFALDAATDVAHAIDRTPIRLRREYRANGLSRLSASVKCAATWESLDADPAAIDAAARAVGFDRGPLELIDLIGIDVHLATVDNLADVYGNRYAPPRKSRERMEEMVDAGTLGKKSGRGFFEWDGQQCLRPEAEEPCDVTPILAALVNEAHRLVADSVADSATVDEILRRGGDSDVGPFEVEEMLGREFLRDVLSERYGETGAGVYDPVF